MAWPAQNTDLNTIKHLWGIIGKAVRTQCIKNKQQLYEKLLDEWSKTKPEIWRHSVDSIPNCIMAVIKGKGGSTK